ncbi:MAG: RnfABCDGE type electron transport complex subunit D [Methanophagales archaeon ANME-1-THS]|nr:MAG: RnfABCDGE type electron transport complex subunit D [Methanophagales archaeon ANME-1-THS]
MPELIVSPSPHIRSDISIERIMYSVIIALIPTTACGVYFFGVPVLTTIMVCILSAVMTEYVALRLMGQQFVMDGSAVITGLLLALCLPPRLPWWMAALGAVFAIAFAKCAFGGLGQNIFNPALIGRTFLIASWPVAMTTWIRPLSYDAVTTATPLGLWKMQQIGTPYINLALGNVGGCIGETSAIAILIGGLFLIAKRYIDWRTPLAYIGTVGLLMLLLGEDPIFHILAGGLLLGAFFMATDYVTTPVTREGRIIFSIGAGIIVVVIRLIGGYPEGVAFSILLMNAFTPLIDRHVQPRVYGIKRKKIFTPTADKE